MAVVVVLLAWVPVAAMYSPGTDYRYALGAVAVAFLGGRVWNSSSGWQAAWLVLGLGVLGACAHEVCRARRS